MTDDLARGVCVGSPAGVPRLDRLAGFPMIVARIEFWPGGDESRAQELESVFIVNDDTGNDRVGNYGVFIGRGQLSQRSRTRQKRFKYVKRITGHARSLGVIDLVEKAFTGLTATNQYRDYRGR